MTRYDLPSQERLRELFDYDPETGVLTAKVARPSRRSPIAVGDVVGYPDAFGYLKATVDGAPLMVHRLIWKWMTGEEPPSHLDHINRVKSDNRWGNLRKADARLNCANSGISRVNTSGAKGVSLSAVTGKWIAAVRVNGQSKFLGQFSARADAAAAYEAAAREAYGDFACADTGPQRVFLDVLELTDERMLAAVASVARGLRSFQLDPTVSERSRTRLAEMANQLAAELARMAPEEYGRMHHAS